MHTSRDRWLAIIYAAAIFVSAFLLFSIQPLVSKRILPWFGGSAAVWTTCLLFFQTFLFAGYAYAHWSHGWLRPRQQAGLHAALILTAIILLRALPSDRWEPAGSEQPIPQILLILTMSIGVPYFVLSATGPLLQAWFARSFPGRVPYRLYALSNVGSLLALASYPFFFEPTFDLPGQARCWTCGFIIYAALCAYIAWRIGWARSKPLEPLLSDAADGARSRRRKSGKNRGAPAAAPIEKQLEQVRPHPAIYAFWLILAAFGSVVLMATTDHVSTDIAVMPLLWVVPLAIYLLTFIIAFDRPAWYRRTLFAAIAIVSCYAAAMTHHLRVGEVKMHSAGTPGLVYSTFVATPANPIPMISLRPSHFLVANFAALFAICMLCHGEIVRTRPAPRFLTSFYLMIALGGALGGVFTALIAPSIFTSYLEWDLSLAIACAASIAIILRACLGLVNRNRGHERRASQYALLAVILLAVFLPSAVLLVDMGEFLFSRGQNVRWRARNFFGALNVQERDPDDELLRRFVLVHGTITHGSQFAHETRRHEPTTYFTRKSGVGRAIEYFQKHLQPGRLRVAVVGLGTGTLAAYANAGDSITFYEINPIDIDVAERSPWFTYLRDCRQRGAHCDVRLGDARLTLRRELEQQQVQSYHVVVLDAFSGDSIPVHLLTTQAFELYLASLSGATTAGNKPDEAGAIAVHISNRFLNLEPVVRAIALHFNLIPLRIGNWADSATDTYDAEWIILTQNRVLAIELARYVTPVDVIKPAVLWTDDRSSLFEIFR